MKVVACPSLIRGVSLWRARGVRSTPSTRGVPDYRDWSAVSGFFPASGRYRTGVTVAWMRASAGATVTSCRIGVAS